MPPVLVGAELDLSHEPVQHEHLENFTGQLCTRNVPKIPKELWAALFGNDCHKLSQATGQTNEVRISLYMCRDPGSLGVSTHVRGKQTLYTNS